MDLFKLDKYDKYFVAFILLIITLFSVGQCFAVEEDTIDVNVVNDISISSSRNYFNTSTGNNIGYFELEPGYIYHIFNNNSGAAIQLATSNNIPGLNVLYNYIGSLDAQTSYDYIGTGYLYFSYSSNLNGSNAIITREKIEGQASAINDLVDNVGVNQLWGVFEGGIDFIGVIVLVAFGLFLIVLLVKKISKGKADF